jgi:hypothetical protein
MPCSGIATPQLLYTRESLSQGDLGQLNKSGSGSYSSAMATSGLLNIEQQN